ncbi:MAG: hypothetical protein ACRECH_05170 [Nitrososphaerales archaeon]
MLTRCGRRHPSLAYFARGKEYVIAFLDDCSNYHVSGAHLHKGAAEAPDALKHALPRGRVQREIYLDNGKQYRANDFTKSSGRIKSRASMESRAIQGEG